jgi:hypothetical protein
MKPTLASLTLLAVLTAVPATAETPPPEEPTAQQATVTKLVVHRPKLHRTVVRSFAPPARPSPGYVLGTIAPLEAAHFGAPLGVLRCRISRESGGRYWASNGQYQGVGQFAASTFSRGLSTMPRGIRLRERSSRLVRAEVVRVWSDGRVTRSKGRYSRVRVLRILKGRISPWASPGHTTWAQVRIMAQALVGRSAVSSGEWSTRSVCG